MAYTDIRSQIIESSLKAQKLGLIKGTSGNISLRSEDGKIIAITPTAVPYEDLTPAMVPLVDESGAVIAGSCQPSSELPMHLAILNARRDIRAVVHTHSKFSTILSNIGQPLPVCTIPLIVYAPDPAPIVPFELPGSEALGKAAVKALGEKGSAVILEMHGLLAVGADLNAAMSCSEYIEEGAEIALYCRLAAGTVREIPPGKISQALEIWASGRAL